MPTPPASREGGKPAKTVFASAPETATSDLFLTNLLFAEMRVLQRPRSQLGFSVGTHRLPAGQIATPRKI